MSNNPQSVSQEDKVEATPNYCDLDTQPIDAVIENISVKKLQSSSSNFWPTESHQPVAKTAIPKLTSGSENYGSSSLNHTEFKPYDDDTGSSLYSSSDSGDGPPTRGRRQKEDKKFSKFNIENDEFKTRGRISKKDGRLTISINETNNRGYLAKALGASFLEHIKPSARREEKKNLDATMDTAPNIPPSLNIVVMVIGSRGDIQPFLKLGKKLKECGHNVRIATHPAFKEFVQLDSDLEFFSVGGDPAELMSFMVKNPGMIPTLETLKKGEVGRRRNQMAMMFEGFWRACINATDDEKDHENLKMMAKRSPFVADAIIANPPSFAHIHCAERLGIPLHLMFTFPYTPTQAFPHPLANIKRSNADPGYTNFMSYPLVEMMTWQGLGDLVNNFRVKTLGLEPVSTLWAPGQLYRLKVPYTYLWSPSLVPKPDDWGPEVDIAGFVFLDLASAYEPPKDLQDFLNTGPTPVYIGFGSIVVDDPDGFSQLIFDAVQKIGVRAVISKGWGELGGDKTPEGVFLLGNVPHDWLFSRVSAVIHHGGAGTTAAGLKFGKPTMIVPFFGDQQFWGNMIKESGAGAPPIPFKDLTAETLADGIGKCLSDQAKASAQKIAAKIEAEGDGAANAVASFHRELPFRGQNSMRCCILENRVAVWTLKDTNLRLCALAAELLVKNNKIQWKQLRLMRHNEWNDFEGPGEPLTGGATAILGTLAGIAAGVGSVPFKIGKNTRQRIKHSEKKQTKSKVARTTIFFGNKKASEGMDEAKKTLLSETLHSGSHSRAGTRNSTKGQVVDRKDKAKSELSASKDTGIAAGKELRNMIGSGFEKTAKTIIRAPMDLSLAVSQGFHNAPRLYGDSTVRRPTRITGLNSGLKAAGKEFVFGIYDGCTGLVMQPYTGARDNGVPGFVKGIGMGLTGFVLKDLAAMLGPFSYTCKGIHKELSKHKQPTKFIRRARVAEGQRDFVLLDEIEIKRNMDIVDHGWSVLEQVRVLTKKIQSPGLKQRFRAVQDPKKLRAHDGFENIKMAEIALEEMKKEAADMNLKIAE
ncbi:Sterol 3-beta-glucosyltransferase [Podosphaera aphanis]|nr:Sterol 3-beta-glucosyltransferase [Podosphaera aphanis]